MKKIMIYSKHGPKKELASLTNGYSGIVLYYAVFVCGIIFGCTLYNSDVSNGFIKNAVGVIMNSPDEKKLALTAVFILISALIALTGALSCLGTASLCVLPAAGGIMYSLTASYLLGERAANGLGFFCLIILPGAVVLSAALISLCAESGSLSKKFALTNLFGRREETDYKSFFIRFAITVLIMLSSLIINMITSKLFSKLF